MHQQDTKTTAGRWSRSAATSDLPTIAFFRASTLLRRNGPVPGILAAHWPGAIMDKSGRRFVVQLSIDRTTKKTNQKTQNYTLDLSSQRGQASCFAGKREPRFSCYECLARRFESVSQNRLKVLLTRTPNKTTTSRSDRALCACSQRTKHLQHSNSC
jgi:hypothetical protein